MQTGITFDKCNVSSRQDAHFHRIFLNYTDGVTKGCGVTYTTAAITVAKGFFVVSGRFVEVTGAESIDVPTVASGQLYCKLVYEIDLTKENTSESFLQGYFKLLTSASAYPAPTQQDLDNGGTLYQMPVCQFVKDTTGVKNWIDIRPIFDASAVYAALQENYKSALAEYQTFFTAEKAEVLALITELQDKGYVNTADQKKLTEYKLPASGWSSSAPYTQTIADSTLVDGDTPQIAFVNDGGSSTMWNKKSIESGYVYQKPEIATGSITFKCPFTKPDVDLIFVKKGV